MIKRMLLKRALPILLSMSMAFGSMPAVVYAAELEQSEPVEETGIVEEAAEPETITQAEMEPVHEEELHEEESRVEESRKAQELHEEVRTAALDTKIVINETLLESYSDNIKYDVDKKVIMAKFDEESANPFDDLKLDMENGRLVTIKVDGTAVSVPENSLRFQWQQKSGGAYTDLAGAAPAKPNDYKLVISLDAIDGVCQAATAELDFTITKRQLFVDVSEITSVIPGTKVQDLTANIMKNYTLQKEDRSWHTNAEKTTIPEDAKDIFVESVTVAVYDAHDTEKTPLSAETVLVEGGDYTTAVRAVLKETSAAEYELADTGIVNIEIDDLVEVKVRVEQKDATAVISKVYCEETPISYETDIKDQINLSITTPDESGDETKGVVIEGAEATLVWYDADKKELGEDPDAAPVDAGTYYLDFQYIPTEETKDIYKASKGNYITVVIEPAPLTLKPAEMTEVYVSGMEEADVLKNADYTLVDAEGEEIFFDKSVFWGVSYDSPDYTQAYEPVFKLIKGEKDKDGKEIWSDNAGSVLDASKYSYKLVFTGKKAVYQADGTQADIRDVNGGEANGANTNYRIVTTAKALSDNYVNVTVSGGITTVIDTTPILEAGVDAAAEQNDLYKPARFVSKVYDGSKLYENRGDYKKARVTVKEDGTEIASNYEDTLSYTWYRIDGESSSPMSTIPVEAGDYRLEIRFSDIANGYASSTANLYYRIEKQLIVVSPEGIPAARKGETVGDYISRVLYEGEHKLYIVPENQYDKAFKTEENLLADWKLVSDKKLVGKYPNGYALDWYVEQLKHSDNGTPLKDENGNIVYKELASSTRFQLLDNKDYRLGVKLTCADSNYCDYEVIYHTNAETEDITTEQKFHNDYADITVQEIGSIEIAIEVDETKLMSTAKDYDAKPFYTSEEEAYADILQAVTVRKISDGEALNQKPTLSYTVYDIDNKCYLNGFTDMVYGGSYKAEIGFPGDETYAPCEPAGITYTIHALELKVIPSMCDDIAAGIYVESESTENSGAIYNLAATAFTCEKMPEEEKSAFIWNTEGFAAYQDCDIYATVRKAGTSEPYNGYIRYNTNYTIQLGGKLAEPYSRNYKVRYEKASFKAAVRGASEVKGANSSFDAETLSTTIVPIEGIPYKSYQSGETVTNSRGETIVLDGNYLEFTITAPKEFMEGSKNYNNYFKDFVFQNSIEKDADGFVTGTNSRTGVIAVMIPIKKEDEEKIKTFRIIWEDGYTEQYRIDFTNAVLLDDLTKAAAPKSLAFNGVNTKMAVGEEQQLDVKIQKAQINDIIYLDYRVTDGAEFVNVTSDDDKKTAGFVTALKVGTATVAAVPVRIVNGKKTDIPGAKPATIKITVSDVSAPSIKKVTAADTWVDFEYIKPSDGYRREVYILEGKNTEDDFGRAMGIFAVEPKYYANEAVSNEKTKLVSQRINGLKANTEYTIYIKNVSGVRTLQDGISSVSESAKGSIKTFKTTLPQLKGLNAYFKQTADSDDSDGDSTDASEPQNITTKKILLSQKTEQLYVSGDFQEKPEYGPADDTDLVQFELPLDTKAHKGYVAPKLTYWLSADKYPISGPVENKADYLFMAGKYYKKTDIAAIDKKGKITLKGIGVVYAYVMDSATGERARAELKIDANAGKMTGKGGKLAVGQGIYLSSLLTYYDGKTKIAGYYKQELSILEEVLKAINETGDFAIVPTDSGDYFITAIKPKAACEFTVMDKLIARSQGEADVAIKLQSAPFEAVKNLKVTDIVDDRFVIHFSYSPQADCETVYTKRHVQFRVDITDARGSAVDSRTVDESSIKSYTDIKKKAVNYSFQYKSNKIVRLSTYKISVTPIYGDDFSAKPAVKAIKTTDFPASYEDRAGNLYGGERISAISYAGTRKVTLDLSTRPYLTSGNAYTLKLSGNTAASDRMTDSLTWKSSDTKVASIKKVNAGTYTVTLNATKAGVAVIEVTSKITKKVIARQPVFVKAVGNAKDDYYGDYEYVGEYVYQLDPFYNSNIEVLTEANPVVVSEYDLAGVTIDGRIPKEHYKWVKFVAPVYGEYTFSVDAAASSPVNMIVDGDGNSYNNSTRKFTIFEGQTYYFKVNGAFEMHVEGRNKEGGQFTDSDTVEIDNDSQHYISFCVAEDNYYTFYTKDGSLNGINKIGTLNENGTFVQISNVAVKTDKDGTVRKSVGLHAGDVIYLHMQPGVYLLYAEKRESAVLSESENHKLSIAADGEQWYFFTAPAAGDYTFQSTDASGVINIDRYDDITKASAADVNMGVHYGTDRKDFIWTIKLKENEKTVLRVYADAGADKEEDEDAAESAKITASISVSAELPSEVKTNGSTTLSVPESSTRWAFAKFTDAGRYTLAIEPIEPADAPAEYAVNVQYYKNEMDGSILSLDTNEIIVSDKSGTRADIKPGDTIYIKAETEKPGTANVKVSLTKIKATTLADGVASPLTVENNREYWYTFTAPSGGVYTFKSVVEQDGENTPHHLAAYRYESMEHRPYVEQFPSENYGFYQRRVLEAGEKVVFKVCAADTAASEIKAQIRAEKFTTQDLTEGVPEPVEIVSGDEKWYSFTAEESGRYRFGKSDTDDNETIITYYKNDAVTVISDPSENYFKEGDAVYIKLSTKKDGPQTTTLKIEKIPMTPITETSTTITLQPGETKFYILTAKVRGKYVFDAAKTVQSEEGEAATVTPDAAVRRFFHTENTSKQHKWGDEVVLARAAFVTFKFSLPSNAEEETFDLTYEIIGEDKEWIEDVDQPLEVTIRKGETETIDFQAPEDGFYAFSTGGLTDARLMPVLDRPGKDPVKGFFDVRSMKAGEVVDLEVSYTYDTTPGEDGEEVPEPESVVFQVKASHSIPQEISVDSSADVTVARHEWKIFQVKVPEDGRYTFCIDNENLQGKMVECEYKNSDFWRGTTGILPYSQKTLKKDETLTFGVYYEQGANASERFQFSIETLVPEPTDGTMEATLKPETAKWFEYTVPKTGSYRIGASNCMVKIYKKVIDSSGTWFSSADISRMAGDKVYIYVHNDSSEERTAKVTVKFMDAPTVVSALGKETSVPFHKTLEGGAWVSFTAPEDGLYQFKVENKSANPVEAVYTSVMFANFFSSPVIGEAGLNDAQASDEGTVTFENKQMEKGDIVYVYIGKPKKTTDVIYITVTGNGE